MGSTALGVIAFLGVDSRTGIVAAEFSVERTNGKRAAWGRGKQQHLVFGSTRNSSIGDEGSRNVWKEQHNRMGAAALGRETGRGIGGISNLGDSSSSGLKEQ